MTSAVQPTQPESTKTQVIRDAAVFIPSSYVAQFFGLINAFLVRHLLGPTMMGIWATLQIILNYGGYLNMGSMAAGAKEIPFHVGRKDHAQAERIKNNIFSFSMLTSCLGAIVVIVGGLIYARNYSLPIRVGLVAVGIMLIVQRILNFSIMLFRGYKNFGLLSKLTIFTAVMDVVFVGILVWLFNIYGLYAAVLGSMAISILYIWKKMPYKVHFELDRKVLQGIGKIGLPLLVVGVVMMILRTMDKILVVKYLGATQMGIYSIALMACNYIYGLATMAAILTLPRFSEKYGAKKDREALGGYLDQANRVLGVVLPIVIGFVYFLAPILIRLLLKQYIGGIPAMQTLMLGTFFLCLVHQPQNFLLSIGKQLQILPAIVTGVVISFVLNYWAVRGPKDLTLVAAATSASYLVTYLATFLTANRYIRRKKSSWIVLGETLLPFVYVVGALIFLDWMFRGVGWMWAVPLELILFGGVCVYPAWRLDRETHVVRKAWQLFYEKLAAVRATHRSKA